jgi:hypothetical protein
MELNGAVSCLQECPTGYFLEQSTCKSCASSCKTCTGTECSECAQDFFLEQGECKQCATDAYFDGLSCIACNPSCKTCSSTATCDSCPKGLIITGEGLCIPATCEPGYYLGATGCLECPVCEHCEEQCKDCNCEDTPQGDDENTVEPTSPDTSTSENGKKKEKQELAQTQTASSVGYAAVIIGALMTGSPSTFVSLFMTVELLSYIPLINLSLTSHQVDLLVGSNNLSSLPDYVPGLTCAPPQHSRDNYDFDCTNFLRTAQKELVILSCIGLIVLASSIAACLVKDCSKHAESVLLKVLPLARRLLLMMIVDCLVKATYSAQLTGFTSVQEVFSWLLIAAVWLLFLCLAVLGVVFSKSSSYPLLAHFLYDDLKPTLSSRLHFSLLILHRMSYAFLVTAIDSFKIQLMLLSVVSTAVSPSQFTAYLIVVRPYQNIKDSVLQLGSHSVITGVFWFLTLHGFKAFDDDELLSRGLAWSLMGNVGIHILAIIAQVGSKAIEVYLTEDKVMLTILS